MRIFHVAVHTESRKADNGEGEVSRMHMGSVSLPVLPVSYGLLCCSPHHLTATNQKRQPHRTREATAPPCVSYEKTKIVEINPGG